MMFEQHYLEEALLQLRKYKELADKAVAQSSDEAFFASLDDECNSIALNMKHMAGNMSSRWTDFLTSDGEKPDRDREREFILQTADNRQHILAQWEDGWRRAFSAIEARGAECTTLGLNP